VAEPKRRWRRIIGRAALVALSLLGLVVLFAIIDGWSAFGTSAEGARLERMKRSPQWDDEAFENPQPLWNDELNAIIGFLDQADDLTPSNPIPVQTVDPALFASPPPSGLRITWLGHSTMLIEIGGRRFLTDPVWGPRSSPLSWIGPERWYPPPIAIADLPSIDAVIISHDHYDHLDYPTMLEIRDWDTTFVAPLGVGAHLEYWGIDVEKIVELDWWERHTVLGVEVVSTPARHASGRILPDSNPTLWAGYALISDDRRVFFSGDTGLFPAMTEIGERLGPFDATMIEVGAYGQDWPDWHIGPEQAIRAHTMLRGRVFMPVHWGLFNLANHGWTEPVERAVAAATAADVTIVTPRPGDSFEPTSPPPVERWWPQLSWRTADEYPIVSTMVD